MLNVDKLFSDAVTISLTEESPAMMKRELPIVYGAYQPVMQTVIVLTVEVWGEERIR